MTFPYGPKPGPPPGGFRPGPPPAHRPAPPGGEAQGYAEPAVPEVSGPGAPAGEIRETGHPAVDAVLRSLANAARLAPAEQIAEYEAAHQVLQETLASIDG